MTILEYRVLSRGRNGFSPLARKKRAAVLVKTQTKVLHLIGFVVLLLIIVVMVGVSVWVTRGFALAIAHPVHLPVTGSPSEVGISAWQNVEFTADGLTLRGWYIPPTQPAPAVILVHGHGANRLNVLPRAAWYAQRGYGVLLFDLRGHGASDGDLTTLGYLERADVVAAYNFLLQQPEIDPHRVLLHGESMGGAAVTRAAVELPAVRGVIVEATFTTFEDNVAQGVRTSIGLPPFPFAPMIVFFGQQEVRANLFDLRPIDQIAQIAPRPLLIMHGERDPLLKVSNAQRLYAAAGEPKMLVLFPTAQHVGLFENDPAFWTQSVSAYLDHLFGV